jgi:hypothetical protein
VTAALRLDWLGSRRSTVVLATIGIVGGLALGAVTARNTAEGVAAIVATLLLVAAILRPANVAVIAVVASFAVQRLGSASTAPGSGGGISYSDALLAVAAFLAMPAVLGRPEFGRIRAALFGLLAYLSALVPTVILHASTRNYLEWLHRLVLIGGALLVGAWIAREGLIRPALRLLLLVAFVIAVLAVADCAGHGFAPAQPLGLNKNFVGALLGAVIVLAVAGGRYIGVGHRQQMLAAVVIALGLLAAQSRGGALAAVAGLLIAFLLDPRGHSRRVRAVGILVAGALGIFAYVSIHSQLTQSTQAKELGSIGIRLNVEKETRRIWRTSPIDGVGLKYFNTGNFGQFAQPANNDVDNELAESGVIGLAGWVILQLTVLTVGLRRRRDNGLVAPALGMVLGILLHGMVDIYWTAGAVSLPFIILGMALAAERTPTSRRSGGKHQSASRGPART